MTGHAPKSLLHFDQLWVSTLPTIHCSIFSLWVERYKVEGNLLLCSFSKIRFILGSCSPTMDWWPDLQYQAAFLLMKQASTPVREQLVFAILSMLLEPWVAMPVPTAGHSFTAGQDWMLPQPPAGFRALSVTVKASLQRGSVCSASH